MRSASIKFTKFNDWDQAGSIASLNLNQIRGKTSVAIKFKQVTNSYNNS